MTQLSPSSRCRPAGRLLVALLLASGGWAWAQQPGKSDGSSSKPSEDRGEGADQGPGRMPGVLMKACKLDREKASWYWRQAAAWIAENEPGSSPERMEKRAVAVCPVMRAYGLSFDHAVRFINHALQDHYIELGFTGSARGELERLVGQCEKDASFCDLNVRLYLVKPALEEVLKRSQESEADRNTARDCYGPKAGLEGRVNCLEDSFVDHFLKPRNYPKHYYQAAVPGGNAERLTLVGRDFLLQMQRDGVALPSAAEEAERMRRSRAP